MKRCVIVGGAPIEDYAAIRGYFRDDDFFIFCDSGLFHADRLFVIPDLIVGDFDSHERPDTDVETIVLPTVKDDTDTVFAAKEALRRGFTDFLLVGVVGARLDHTLCNVYLLYDLFSRGCGALIVDDSSEMLMVGKTPETVEKRFPFFSLLNITGAARGVTVTGAKYPLENAEITSGYQYAVSNEVASDLAVITVSDGCLLLIKDR